MPGDSSIHALEDGIPQPHSIQQHAQSYSLGLGNWRHSLPLHQPFTFRGTARLRLPAFPAPNRYHQITWEILMPRNFAIRLRCPQGDADSWVTLFNREESLEQILQQTWDFKCREHGPQKGIPQEAMEVAPLDDPSPSPIAPSSLAVPFPATPRKENTALRRARSLARARGDLRLCWQGRRLPRRY